MKVNFLIVGTQKGGTTALARFISKHPEIAMASKKEVHFFDRDEFFHESSPEYERYHRYFSRISSDVTFRAIGEATPSYMWWKKAPKRMSEYNPNMKLVFILRNPIERAYSHYIMQKRRKRESLPFFLAIRIERLRNAFTFPVQNRLYSYVDRGYYSKQIRNLLQYFSTEQMLFLKTEDLKEKHCITIYKICDFLHIEKICATEPQTIFSHEYGRMSAIDRSYLQKKFRQEIAELEDLLEWDCSRWQ